MSSNCFSFKKDQFNRLFPFYILVNNRFAIESCGISLQKLAKSNINQSFSTCFKITRPEMDVVDFESIKATHGQLITLQLQSGHKTILRGQFEFLDDTNQLLFVGSPWFYSMEQVNESNLKLSDFANHDPLIDLLHILKTQEIVNADLKQLVATINSQKNTLKNNEEKYRNIIENMNLGLLEVDVNENITYANHSFCEMSGYTIKELEGKRASEIFATGESTKVLQEKTKNREKGIADAYEIEVIDKQGNGKWWLISGAPRYNDKGDLVGSIGIHLDITEQKQLERELIEAKVQAEHLAKTKEAFLANMSHEIRTPMNAIMGMSRQLAKTDLLPQQKFYLDVIHSASDNLLVIINDILDLSKVEAGKLSFESIGFESNSIAERVIRVLAHKAEEKGLKLQNSYFDTRIAPVLIGDPYRLNQVLFNLIGNSIKFTEKGFVDLSLELIEDNEFSQLIKIKVKDTGIGMDEDFVKNLFEKFSQENESITRKYGGTGLGMSICKNLVELMGGEIRAESIKGKGTTIILKIEFKKGNYTDVPEENIVQFNSNFLQGRKILITDDNELNRLVASIILQNYGAQIVEAFNGQQAIEVLKKQHFDVILMDIQMPVMNGIEATKALRQSKCNVPIIALTAAAIKGERQKCISAGMSDYITKPFKEEVLLKIIDKLLKNNNVEARHLKNEESKEELLFDLTELEDISRGNKDFILKMLNIFCEQTPLILHEMLDAYKQGQYEKMGAMAHKMKPSIDNLKIMPLKQIIRDIELLGRENKHSAQLPIMLQQTESILQEVFVQLKKYKS